MAVSALPSSAVLAENKDPLSPEDISLTSLLEVEVVPSENIACDDAACEASEDFLESTGAVSYDDGGWGRYSCYLVYNRLSAEQKKIWDRLEESCIELITDSGKTAASTAYVSSDLLSNDEILSVMKMFRYSNPQYYFLRNAISGKAVKDEAGNTVSVTAPYSILLYDSFKDGSKRVEAARQIKQQADEWVLQAEEICDTDFEKAKYFHDVIAKSVSYDRSDINNDAYEQGHYTQSAYSVFAGEKAVCAGYAQAYEMVLNAADIDSVAVTSKDHEWNLIRVGDLWYHVDVTWDDSSDGGSYRYFMKSDSSISYDTVANAANHTVEDYWKDYIPKCSFDSGSTTDYAGAAIELEASAAMPEIVSEKTEGGYKVALTCDNKSAVIFYTLDGQMPSQAASKSYIYTEPFLEKDISGLQAVAVLDGLHDSDISQMSNDWSGDDSSEEQTEEPSDSGEPDDDTQTDDDTQSGKIAQTITCASSYSKTVGDVPFNLNAKAKTALTYESSNKNVCRVDSKGRVTISGKGSAYITVVAASDEVYKKAVKRVRLTVGALKAASISKTSRISDSKGKIIWKKQPLASGYIVQYSTGKSFKDSKKSIVKKSTLSSLTLSGLKKDTLYYVRIQAYKKLGGKTYYSAWSSAKTIAKKQA